LPSPLWGGWPAGPGGGGQASGWTKDGALRLHLPPRCARHAAIRERHLPDTADNSVGDQ